MSLGLPDTMACADGRSSSKWEHEMKGYRRLMNASNGGVETMTWPSPLKPADAKSGWLRECLSTICRELRITIVVWRAYGFQDLDRCMEKWGR